MAIHSHFFIFIICPLITIIQGQNPTGDVNSLSSASFVPLLHLSRSLTEARLSLGTKLELVCLGFWCASRCLPRLPWDFIPHFGLTFVPCSVGSDFKSQSDLTTERIHVTSGSRVPEQRCAAGSCVIPDSHNPHSQTDFGRSGTGRVCELIAPSCE